MSFETAAGTVMSCSVAVPATFDDDGYKVLEFTKIGEISNAGEFLGKMFSLVEFTSLDLPGVQKGKGSFTNGQVSPDLAAQFDDVGQLLLDVAGDSSNNAISTLSFKVVTQTLYTIYFQGLVMGKPLTIGESNSVVMSKPVIEVTHQDIVRVAPV